MFNIRQLFSAVLVIYSLLFTPFIHAQDEPLSVESLNGQLSEIYQCQHPEKAERLFIVHHINSSALPCDVRQLQNNKLRTLWQAQFKEGFCHQKLQTQIEQMQARQWQCQTIDNFELLQLAAMQAHKESLTAYRQFDVLRLFLRKQLALIDVREYPEYQQAHIPGAINMPYSGLTEKTALEEYRGQKIILYSQNEQQAIAAANRLIELGLKADGYLKGGMQQWRKAQRAIASCDEGRC